MWFLIISCTIFLIFNFSTAKFHHEPLNHISSNDRCQHAGDQCGEDADCCSRLACYSIQDQNLCLSSKQYEKRYADDFVTPPYYNPKNHLYPYGISMRPFPFYNAYGTKQSNSYQRNKLEWDNCQFHEDCGESNCCYAHFRFRSLPKSFCRPNRNNKSDLCEPLTKYRSLKDVPAWKQHQKQLQQRQQVEDEQQEQPFPLRNPYFSG